MLLKKLLVLVTLVLLGFMPLLAFLPVQAETYYAHQTVVDTVQVTQSTPQAILLRLMQANGMSGNLGIGLINDTKTLNAYTDGKKIYMTTGLWNTLQTDDQRAFTIAHELSHVALNHVPKTQARHIGLSILNSLLARKTGNSTVAAIARQQGINLVDKKFSRSDEYGADDLGLQIMKKAGYNPMAAIEVFDIFEKNTQITRRSPEFMQDHPLNRSRITTLAKKYQLGTTTAIH